MYRISLASIGCKGVLFVIFFKFLHCTFITVSTVYDFHFQHSYYFIISVDTSIVLFSNTVQ